MNTEKAAVIGLGLIGASLAAALQNTFREVVGWDSHEPTLSTTASNRHITTRATSLFDAVQDADLVVLCMHVSGIIDTLGVISLHLKDGAVVLDVGSSKAAVVTAMDNLPDTVYAIGGHPMTGRLTTGFSSPTARLFEHTTFILSPTQRHTSEQCLADVQSLVESIGSRALLMDAAHHDQMVALVSHIVPLVPRAMVAAANKDDDVWQLAAGGFKNGTQAAADGLGFWLDVLVTNPTGIASALRLLSEELEGIAQMVETGDVEAMQQWANDVRQVWLKHYGEE